MFNLIKTILNLLNINDKEKIEEEKSVETNIKYLYINENMILNGVKYEFGKRYYNEIEVKNSIYDFTFDSLANMKNYKIIKIKIFDNEIFTTRDFKIIKEIDYKQFLHSSEPEYKLISIVKNKEEKAIKESFKDFDIDPLILSSQADAIINSGLHKYLDKLLDKLPAHNVICAILKNGRYKDVKHFLYDKNCYFKFAIAIVETGINRYIKTFLYNNILQCHGYELHVIQEIAKHCEKKDLDYIMNKYKEDFIKIEIAKRGYDDHIKLLLSEKNYSDIKHIAFSMIK